MFINTEICIAKKHIAIEKDWIVRIATFFGRFALYFVAIMAFGKPAWGSPPTTATSLPPEFWDGAPTAWSALRNGTVSIQGTFLSEFKKIPRNASATQPAETIFVRSNEYKINNTLQDMLCTLKVVPGNGHAYVFGRNSNYSFEISSRNNGDVWSIDQFARVGEDRELRGRQEEDVYRYIDAGERICGVRVSDITSGIGGKLISVEWDRSGVDRHLILHFNRWLADSDDAAHCEAVLDPHFHWAVISYKQEREWGVMRGRVEYEPLIKEFAFPRRISEEDVDSSGRITFAQINNFALPIKLDQKDFSDAKSFRLEAYGLEAPHTHASPSVGG